MSKERKLLERVWASEKWDMPEDLQIKIKELLAQPEQKPVAWVSLSDIEWMNIVNNQKILELTNGRHNSEEAVNLAVKMTEEICKKNNLNLIPKREPLSDENIRTIINQLPSEVDLETGIEFCKIIEKAHGIGEL